MDQIILSDQWIPSEHAHFVLDFLKNKVKNRKPFYFQSPQIHLRSYLYNLIIKLSNRLKFYCSTIHLAIYLLDSFMDKRDVADNELLELYSLGCLILAAKFEEKDNIIPKISELRNLVNIEFSTRRFISIEFSLLKFFDFSLNLPTTAHFVEFYILFAYSSDDEKYNVFKKKDHKKRLKELVKGYLELTNIEVNYITMSPPLLAAACIACARRFLGLPTWSPILEQVTEYKLHHLYPCMKYITGNDFPRFRKHKKRSRESSDQGYSTGTSSTSSTPPSPKRRKK